MCSQKICDLFLLPVSGEGETERLSSPTITARTVRPWESLASGVLASKSKQHLSAQFCA